MGLFAVEPGARYTRSVIGRRWMAVGVVGAVLWCAPNAPASDGDEPLPLISAERLGDADAAGPADAETQHELSPAEREALAAQGYELEIDDTIVTQTRIQPPSGEQKDAKPKGSFGRTMDTVGRGMVAVASVLLPLAAAVAPFFLF
jgi:hypothetical protein